MQLSTQLRLPSTCVAPKRQSYTPVTPSYTRNSRRPIDAPAREARPSAHALRGEAAGSGQFGDVRQNVGVRLLGGIMNTKKDQSFSWRPLAAALSIMFFATGVSLAADVKVTLSGDQEVPPVKTEASGSGTTTVNADKTVSGSGATNGITRTAEHIPDAG